MSDIVRTKALCWSVVRTDGVSIKGTSLDRDLVVTASGYAGTYPAMLGVIGSNVKSSADLSIDNLEVQSALFTTGVEASDIEAGLYDGAAVVVFETDFTNPASVTILRTGTIGQITRTAEGGYTAEIRGLAQQLAQVITDVYQLSCRAEFGSGDETRVIRRCGVDRAAYTFSDVVTAITTPDRKFTSSSLGAAHPVNGYFQYGEIIFTSGSNDGYTRRVKTYSSTGLTDLTEPLPYDIEVGDTFSIVAGCDKSLATCRDKFSNVINFKGEPDIPGNDALIQIASE